MRSLATTVRSWRRGRTRHTSQTKEVLQEPKVSPMRCPHMEREPSPLCNRHTRAKNVSRQNSVQVPFHIFNPKGYPPIKIPHHTIQPASKPPISHLIQLKQASGKTNSQYPFGLKRSASFSTLTSFTLPSSSLKRSSENPLIVYGYL